MRHFAYGSNMDWQQMRDRCPSAEFAGVAVLRNYRLAFTRYSRNRRCGVADAVADDRREVWGVVYDIDDQHVAGVDASEGYRPGRAINSYLRETGVVDLHGDAARPATVEIYFAVRQEQSPLPSQAYKNLILAGANHWHLPEHYIRDVLEAIEVGGD